MSRIVLSGILKLSALSEFFDRVIDGSIDITRANLNAKEEVLKVPESERKALDDETRIGDAGYAGFNPHEGLDIEELMKRGVKNPHAAHHPGGANPHADRNAAAKAASESIPASSSSKAKSETSESSSSEAEPPSSSPSVVEPSSSMPETSASMDESSPKDAEPTTTLAAKETSAHTAKETEHAAEHAKDEL